MNRREAEALYDAGKEPTVAKLLEYDIENTQLKEKIAQLQRNSQNSSNPPSSDTPGERKQGDRPIIRNANLVVNLGIREHIGT